MIHPASHRPGDSGDHGRSSGTSETGSRAESEHFWVRLYGRESVGARADLVSERRDEVNSPVLLSGVKLVRVDYRSLWALLQLCNSATESASGERRQFGCEATRLKGMARWLAAGSQQLYSSLISCCSLLPVLTARSRSLCRSQHHRHLSPSAEHARCSSCGTFK